MANMTFKEFMLEQFGIESITSFWEDFSIADYFGKEAIQDTFNRAFEEWRYNYKYLTELVIVLNVKCCNHYKKNRDVSELYGKLYHQADAYAYENLKGEEMQYYFNVTD